MIKLLPESFILLRDISQGNDQDSLAWIGAGNY